MPKLGAFFFNNFILSFKRLFSFDKLFLSNFILSVSIKYSTSIFLIIKLINSYISKIKFIICGHNNLINLFLLAKIDIFILSHNSNNIIFFSFSLNSILNTDLINLIFIFFISFPLLFI